MIFVSGIVWVSNKFFWSFFFGLVVGFVILVILVVFFFFVGFLIIIGKFMKFEEIIKDLFKNCVKLMNKENL